MFSHTVIKDLQGTHTNQQTNIQTQTTTRINNIIYNTITNTSTTQATTQSIVLINIFSSWTNAQDLWLHGYWSWDWSDSHVHVLSVNVSQNAFYTDPTTPPQYGYTADRRYYAYNLIEVCSSPTPAPFFVFFVCVFFMPSFLKPLLHWPLLFYTLYHKCIL